VGLKNQSWEFPGAKVFALVAIQYAGLVAAPSQLAAQEKTDDVAAAIVRLERSGPEHRRLACGGVCCRDFINTDVMAKWLAKPMVIAFKAGTMGSRNESATSSDGYGNTAMATAPGPGRGGERRLQADSHERWTDAWVKMPDGEWQCGRPSVRGEEQTGAAPRLVDRRIF